MESERFEWDDWKATQNQVKHGVDFEEAATVFDDEHMLDLDDIAHSWEEPRTFLIGRSIQSRVLLVVYTQRAWKDALSGFALSARARPHRRRGWYMRHGDEADMDMENEDNMLPEYDLSKAVPGYTAFRIGEDSDDEKGVEQFWHGLGYEVERITEPTLRFSKAPDFLLKRQGVAVAVCEVKSMGEFDYSVKVNHRDGSVTETRHNWRDSNPERVFQRAERAVGQLSYWNQDGALANLFVFVNHDPQTKREAVQQSLMGIAGIDGTFWFESENDVVDANPVPIVSPEGRRRIECKMGLLLDARLNLNPAA